MCTSYNKYNYGLKNQNHLCSDSGFVQRSAGLCVWGRAVGCCVEVCRSSYSVPGRYNSTSHVARTTDHMQLCSVSRLYNNRLKYTIFLPLLYYTYMFSIFVCNLDQITSQFSLWIELLAITDDIHPVIVAFSCCAQT